MLSGKRAFDGEDLADATASVVAREPDWGALPADLPWQTAAGADGYREICGRFGP